MTEPLKPGEFIAKGVIMRAEGIRATGPATRDCLYGTDQILHLRPGHSDFPAALAALNALHEESQRVIIPLTEHYRVVRDKDGEIVEWQYSEGLWRETHGASYDAILAALHYREGE